MKTTLRDVEEFLLDRLQKGQDVIIPLLQKFREVSCQIEGNKLKFQLRTSAVFCNLPER